MTAAALPPSPPVWRLALVDIVTTTIVIAAVLGMLAFLGVQQVALRHDVDDLRRELNTGFAQLRRDVAQDAAQQRQELTAQLAESRKEFAAQLSAIANGITAARAVVQPPPQIIIVPPGATVPAPEKP